MVRPARFLALRLARLTFALAGALVKLAAALIGFARPGADFGLVIEHRRETPRPLPFFIVTPDDDELASGGDDPDDEPTGPACPDCSGRGNHIQVVDLVAMRGTDLVECRACRGTGLDPDPEADPDPLISDRVVAEYLASEPDPE